MKRILYVLLAMLMVLSGCTGSDEETQPAGEISENQADEEAAARVGELEVVAENLQVPWSINKVDETFYLSERPGSIVKIDSGGTTRQKVSLKKELSQAAEAGLLGFVLAPNFEQSNKAFAYYTYENGTGQYNRIVELTLKNDEWTEGKLLLDHIPSGRFHHGGRLKIGPDGKLYATAGDAATNPEIAQDLTSLRGKILRMNLDGSVPADNPFEDSFVYSYGHRNPQGIAWSKDGTMYASEHGPSAHDEINRIEAGKNYGWPEITGDATKQGMETPIFQSGSGTWAPSGMAAHNGKLYVATLRGNALREVDPAAKTTKEVVTGVGRIRDVLADGEYLYFVSNNTDGRGTPSEGDDKLYRVKLDELR
ncbi:PQQ-dependent sugar dehydrogenase [Bacillus sp. ISL-35]|uniref:PQQ-dependent sugar dehydrogenase n=1 Tax=Bacillus sp. ISL-35 TaxID=2819122 RepID=UPI001BE72EBE|nr:PQQ-dependent sugar dehydrogenase [Bacillus sp. ISL-35]MBT2680242.1 PQQ-dependent sugar dehydrogenase [Bacillus sp. ISL-35]MBT2702833.1 PQQ-dependent sugar dehydrogenase [Chryseobacterium sp. ISL-80]